MKRYLKKLIAGAVSLTMLSSVLAMLPAAADNGGTGTEATDLLLQFDGQEIGSTPAAEVPGGAFAVNTDTRAVEIVADPDDADGRAIQTAKKQAKMKIGLSS